MNKLISTNIKSWSLPEQWASFKVHDGKNLCCWILGKVEHFPPLSFSSVFISLQNFQLFFFSLVT
jgi:hypothetical protein